MMRIFFVTMSVLVLVSICSVVSAQDAAETQKQIDALKEELVILRAQRLDNNRTLVPPGTIVAFWGVAPPPGWLLCDGKTKLDTPEYARLKDVVGDVVPDLQGEFLRGLDLGKGIDPNRQLGTRQPDEFKSHNHTATVSGDGAHIHHWQGHFSASNGPGWRLVQSRSENPNGNDPVDQTTRLDGGHTHSVTIDSTGKGETRPRNVAVSYIIKF